ncbi:MAG: photosystem II biogenesis protein Psp29 [Xenococcaceae cyanobacterium]
MDKIRTVSDTKRDFYAHHTRPINSLYRRVVEELMVEMHLLSVNVDFRCDPIYCLGVVTSFDRFMQGYRPEQDKESIFTALCQSIGDDAQQYRQEAESLLALAKPMSAQELISWISSPTSTDGADSLLESLQAIANNPKFKYSRLFAIGLYTLLEETDSELVKDEKQRNQALKQFCEALHLPEEKMQKDLELYRSNLEKIDQMLSVLEDALQAERKKREKRAQEKGVAE